MIIGLTHSGFSVSNLDSALDFFKEKLEIEEIRSQLSDQDYLSRVTGFPGARLKIGFVRKEGEIFELHLLKLVCIQLSGCSSIMIIFSFIYRNIFKNNSQEQHPVLQPRC